MLEWLKLNSKAISVVITAMISFRLRKWFHLDDLSWLGLPASEDGAGFFQSLLSSGVQASVDGFMALVMGGITWLVPFGKKFWRERILGETVIVLTADGTAVKGMVYETRNNKDEMATSLPQAEIPTETPPIVINEAEVQIKPTTEAPK